MSVRGLLHGGLGRTPAPLRPASVGASWGSGAAGSCSGSSPPEGLSVGSLSSRVDVVGGGGGTAGVPGRARRPGGLGDPGTPPECRGWGWGRRREAGGGPGRSPPSGIRAETDTSGLGWGAAASPPPRVPMAAEPLTELEAAIETVVTTFFTFAGQEGRKGSLSINEFKELVTQQLPHLLKDVDSLDEKMESLDVNQDSELKFHEYWRLIGELAKEIRKEKALEIRKK
uniref:S100/CaBP-9k-type calcium binding subdomain domain-containing protein n=4 Tax=Felinae TaxID=338152 RepID=A0ABI7WVN8_FELCA